jgi:hypothetical protein
MARKTSGHCLNFGSEHEFQHPEGVRTSLALHTEGMVGGLVGGLGGRMIPTAVRVIVYLPELEKRTILPP